MRVLHVPDYTLQNPYQWLLARALAEQGTGVAFSDGLGVMPLVGAVRAYGRPDVVHLHWPHPFVVRETRLASLVAGMSLLAQVAALRAGGVGVVWTVHNLADHDRGRTDEEHLVQWVLGRIVDRLIVHSPSAKSLVAATLGVEASRVDIVPHGHYRDALPAAPERPAARAALGLGDGHRVVLLLGQLRRYRGATSLLEAAADIEEPDLRVIIAGRIADAGLRCELEELASRDARALLRFGFVPDDEVAALHAAADVVALPYSESLTSGSALLALSFGRAVVAPRLGGLPDVLDDHGAVLYDPGEEDALRRALDRALDRDLEAMGRHNARLADALGWAGIASRTRDVYARVAPARLRFSPSCVSLEADPWTHRLSLARRDLTRALGAGRPCALADEGQLSWALAEDRPVTPFPERDGAWAGTPADEAGAEAALEQWRSTGPRDLVFAWPAFWWFETFPAFHRRLRGLARCVLRTDRVAVFRLREGRHAG